VSKLTESRQAISRGFVINGLRDGPFQLDEFIRQGADHGFSREDILAAGRWLNAQEHVLDGETYWTRPANLYAIWWGNRPAHWYRRQRNEASAA
jgi:hypothetical protein